MDEHIYVYIIILWKHKLINNTNKINTGRVNDNGFKIKHNNFKTQNYIKYISIKRQLSTIY